MRRLDQICRYQSRGVIGVGLGGREEEYPAALYEGVYKEAGRRGLFLTAHAGEAAGAQSVWAALNRLGVRRIGHGVRAYEDPVLVTVLRERKIPLEMCITSNVRTGVVRSVREHPIRQLFQRGVKVTVNTDDPTMFGCTLAGEYLLLLNDLDFTPGEIRTVCLNGVEATVLDMTRKSALARQVEQAWSGVV